MQTLLLIDDHPEVLDLLQLLLERATGLTVIPVLQTAGTDQQIVEMVERLKPVAILLDGQLHGTTGPELTLSILAAVPGVRVIGFSSAASFRQAFLAHGAVDFVQKDVADPDGTVQRVVEAVQQLLS